LQRNDNSATGEASNST